MSKIENAFRSSLTRYLVGAVCITALLAIIVGYTLIYFGTIYVENIFDNNEMNKNWQIRYVDDLQKYVEDNQITTNNISRLQEWTDENRYVYLSIYYDQHTIFNSDYAYLEYDQKESIRSGEYEGEEDENNLLDVGDDSDELESEDYVYRLLLSDGTIVKVDIFCYDYWKYNYYVWGFCVTLAVLLFVVILTKLIHRKIRYINNMARELQILEAGNLEYPITIRGVDELANLANGIEQMRLSIIDNIKKEQSVLQKNRELVTSMSHDLRTPLTTLTGYLEMLMMKKELDPEKARHYLQLSLEKSYEIKELSDDLFEYFLVYGEQEKRIHVVPVSAYFLIEDLIHNQLLCLEEEGYIIVGEHQISPDDGDCMIHTKYMQRVLNNIISNLRKYADKERPIYVGAQILNHKMMIYVRNTILKQIDLQESTKIGIITCERIMKLHGGDFEKKQTEEEFEVKLIIPME